MDATTSYAEQVTRGKLVTGQWVRLACQRHLADLKHGHKRGLRWDVNGAAAVIEFFKLLRHSKGPMARKPFDLQPWQQFFVGSIYGWKRADGRRRFREAQLEVARKNGKTTLASGIGLAELVLTGESGAEVYTVATKRDQARLTHRQSVRMVQSSPALKKHIQIFKDALTHDRSGSTYIPLSADGHTHDGLNPSAAVMDEIHAWRDRLLYDVIETGMDARAQPLILITTTAGHNRHSIWWERRELATKVLRGEVQDDSLFAYIATLDDGDEWTDPNVWVKGNPNLGVTIQVDDFAARVRQAQATPGKQNSFKRLRLNVPTDSATLWIARERWDACGGLTDVSMLEGRMCYTGVDLSTVRDLTAAVHVFPSEDPREPVCMIPRFWLPEEDLEERSDIDGVPYEQWAADGHIRLIPGRIIDNDVLLEDLLADAAELEIAGFLFDPWGAVQLMKKLEAEGHTVIPFRQGFKSYKAPVLLFESLVEQRRILHTGSPVLASCVANTAIEEDAAGNRKPSKRHSTGRIDGAVAAIMGLAGLLEEDPAEGGSIL